MKRIVTCAVAPFESTTSRFNQCVPGRVGRPRSTPRESRCSFAWRSARPVASQRSCPDAAGCLEPVVEPAADATEERAVHPDDERRLLLPYLRRCRGRRCECVEDRLMDERGDRETARRNEVDVVGLVPLGMRRRVGVPVENAELGVVERGGCEHGVLLRVLRADFVQVHPQHVLHAVVAQCVERELDVAGERRRARRCSRRRSPRPGRVSSASR